MVLKEIFTPNTAVDRRMRQFIVAGWLLFVAVFWIFSPSVFLPKPGEVGHALHDLWFYEDLGIELFTSVRLNLEAIAISTLISLGLAYASTISVLRPVVGFSGKLRFLSLAGLGFAFTLMTSNGHQLKLAILVFAVTVFFVVSMQDVIDSIPKEQYDLARTLKMNDWRSLYEVVVLGQIDQAFLVLRQNAAMSWLMISIVETMSRSGGGIGTLLANSSKHFHMSEVMAIQIIVLILGLLQDQAIVALRGLCCPYADLARKRS